MCVVSFRVNVHQSNSSAETEWFEYKLLLCFSLVSFLPFFFWQNLAMFLSMLVAWMIPDVPRSLRDQLKKENMALMEFLLDHDKEACAKTQSPKRPVPCFPANIDIIVNAAPEEDDMCQVVEEEEELKVEINMDEPGRCDNSNAEVGKLLEEAEDQNQEEQKGDGGDEGGEEEGNENEDVKEECEERSNEEEREKEEGETQGEESKNDAAEENFTVDLDAFMLKLGLLGKMKKIIST